MAHEWNGGINYRPEDLEEGGQIIDRNQEMEIHTRI